VTTINGLLILVVILIGLLGAVIGGILAYWGSPTAKTIRAGLIAFAGTVCVVALLMSNAGLFSK